jgi:RTX calcium-binding nonapeptide repeat (4 copies)
MAESSRPNLIGFVADVSARTQFILPNADHINSLPFDGIIVNIPASWSSMSPGAIVTEADVKFWLDPLKNFNAGKENYIIMQMDKPGNLSDDAAWAQVAQNWKTVAKVAQEAGFKGVFFDNEEYAGKWMNFPEDFSPDEAALGLEALQAKASQRGQELMAAIASEMPDGKVAIAHGPYLSVPSNPDAPPAAQLQAGGPSFHELRGPFFTGFLEALGPNQQLIDGGELYALRTAAEFKQSADYRNNTVQNLIDWDVQPDALANWADRVDTGHMVYTDEFPAGYDHTPETLTATLLNAFDNSEEAVFLYSESAQIPWLTPNETNKVWIEAVARAVELADNTQRGTAAAETITGSAKMDRLFGDGGADTLNGKDGDDIIDGGDGEDFILGELGNDQIFGGAGKDRLVGGSGNDKLYGGAGDDRLNGGDGIDVLRGNTGLDVMYGLAGGDYFVFDFGDSGPAWELIDKIGDFTKGGIGIGDRIDFVADLSIARAANPASATQASISAATGIATFAAGSGTNISDAVSDVTASFSADGEKAGEFALFQFINLPSYFLLVSDGVAGATAGDVLIELIGITSISGVDLTTGDLLLI